MAGKAKRKPRRADTKIFTDRLRDLAISANKPVSNYALLESLGWDEKRYDSAKAKLESQKIIARGGGRGGSVSFVEDSSANALKLFVSYCHADEDVKANLLKHLEPLRKIMLIDSWHDREIKPGENWENEISDNLETADIVLLIVSIDFINSDYCYNKELTRALELHDENRTRVIPIIIRSCLWTSTPFSKLQALPKGAKPVAQWADQDEALTEVAMGIEEAAKDIRAKRQVSAH